MLQLAAGLGQFRRAMLCMLVAGVFACAQSGSSQTVVSIQAIQQNLPNSPYLGQTVSTSGTVVGVMQQGGFYMQAANGYGIQVLPQAGVASLCATVGNVVSVTGTVLNGTAVTGAGTPGTSISASSCQVTGTGGTTSGSTKLTSATGYGQDLPLTGMSVSNTTFYAVSPTTGTTNAATGIVSSTGQFWVDLAVPTNGHLFKSSGLELDAFYPPPPAPAKASSPGIPTWSGNPQRLFVDTAAFGGTPIDIGAGQTLTCTPGTGITAGATAGVGLMDYSLGYNRLLVYKTTTCTVSGSIAPSITSPADSRHFHVATMFLNNFYGQSTPAYSTRLAKAALALINVFGAPDIVSVQEVEDLATLQAIGDAANALPGSTTSYKAYWAASNDSTNLALGFLVNTNTAAVSRYYQINANDTFTKLDGTQEPLWERPPLVLEAALLRAGQNYQLEVVNIETTSRDGIDDPTNGPNVWERRGQQAEELSVFANAEQNRGQNLVIAGEFNAYSFSDGFVDVTDIVDNGSGLPKQGAVAQYEPSVTSPGMYNFVGSIMVTNSTYNIIENGNARSVEHILCSETQSSTASGSLYSYIDFVTQPHWTTDFPAINANDPTIPSGFTARDGFVGAFLIPPVPTNASLTPSAVNFGSVTRGASTSQTLTFTNTSTFPSTVNVTNLSISGQNAADFTVTSNCTALSQNASCTLTVTYAPTVTGAESATLTVASDAGGNPTLTAALSGTGLDTTATLSPAAATFPTTATGLSSAPSSFTWTNTSVVPLSITGVTTSGDFAVSASTCSGAIAPGGACMVAVVFSPTTAGVRTGSLAVQSTSSADPVLTAFLTGTGTANIGASPSPLVFGYVDVGGTAGPLTVTVTNYSQHAIALNGMSISGPYTFASRCPAVLAAASQCGIDVTFKPTSVGSPQGAPNQLVIATGDPGTPVLTVQLTGVGVDFSVSMGSGGQSVIAGRAVKLSATLTPLGGFTGQLQMACTAPADVGGTTCIAAQPPPLAQPLSVSVVVSTTSQYTVIGYTGAGSGRAGWFALLAGLSAFVLFLRGRRRRGYKILLLLASFCAVGWLNVGCSGKLPDHNADPTYPGTYTYTVTASDGFLTHSATFDLTVTAK